MISWRRPRAAAVRTVCRSAWRGHFVLAPRSASWSAEAQDLKQEDLRHAAYARYGAIILNSKRQGEGTGVVLWCHLAGVRP